MKFRELEVIRAIAAVYVALSHYAEFLKLDKSNIFELIFGSFAQEMVICFFLLSGFVIEHSYSRRKISWKKFLIKRFVRIYPILIVALSISLIIDIRLDNRIEMDKLLGNFFSLQDLGGRPGVMYGTYYNNALWSLSYEWWFYVIYIVINQLKKKKIVFVIGLIIISTILYHFYEFQIFRWLKYFSIWYSGVVLNQLYRVSQLNFRSVSFRIILPLLFIPMIQSLLIFINSAYVSIASNKPLNFELLMEFRHFLASIAIIVLVLLYRKTGMSFFRNSYVEYVSTFSYGIYVLHYPILYLFGNSTDFIYLTIIFISTLLLSLILERVIQKKISNYVFQQNWYQKIL